MVKVYILKIFASWYSIGLSHIFYSQNNDSYSDGSEITNLFDNQGDYKPNSVTRLWINRSTGKITESNMPMTDEEPFFVIYVDAILGIVQIMNTSHLVVVTESDEVADLELGNLSFNGKNKGKIMTIKEVKFFPIDNSSDTLSKFKNKDQQNLFDPSILSNNNNSNNKTNGSENSSNEDGLDNLYYILIMISKILSTGHYYSYDTDLTNTMQSLYLNEHIPPKKAVNERRDDFITEEFLLMNEKLYNVAVQDFNWCFMISTKLPNRWKTVVIQGYVGYVNENVNGEMVETLLIGRRSIKRSGTRFVSRGLDLDGNVGNFVDSEVRLRVDSGSWYSHSQVRGSVPVFWGQSGTGKKIEFNDKLDNLKPFFEHIEILKEHYKPCTYKLFVSLLDVKNNINESLLHEIFENVVNGHNMTLEQNPEEPKITLVNYNYNSNAKWNTHEIVIQFVLEEILDHFTKIGFFDEEKHLKWLKNGSNAHKEDTNGSNGHSIRGLQKGILRTNCLDCLDRSNIFQWIASWVAVHMILNSRRKDNSIKIKNRLDHMLFGSQGTQNDFFTTFRNLWCDHGDYISIHQTGAPCTLSQRVKQPETSFNSLWYYGKVMAQRHYQSRFKDFKRQEGLDMLSQYCASDVPSQAYQKDTDSELDTKHQRHSFAIPERMGAYHKPSPFSDSMETEHSRKRTDTDSSEPLPVNVIYLDITSSEGTNGYDVIYLGKKIIFKAREQFLFGVIKKGKRPIWTPKPGDYPDIVLIKPGLDDKPVVRVYFPKRVKNQKYIYEGLSQIQDEDSMQTIHKGESVDHETVLRPGLFEQLEHKGLEIFEFSKHLKPLKPKIVSVDIKPTVITEGVEYRYNSSDQSYTFTAMQGFLIDKVTKSGMVLWDFRDHSYGYAVRAFVGNNEYGERVFRVYFPGAVPLHTDACPKPKPQIVFNQPEDSSGPESVFESDEVEIIPINVDIKRKLSDNLVRYEHNSNLDTHTFSSIYPCLINKVTRGKEVLWDCKDHGNEYGNQVLIFKQKNGKWMLRVYYGNQIPKPKNYVHIWDPGQLQEEITEFEQVYPDNGRYTPKIVVEDSRG